MEYVIPDLPELVTGKGSLGPCGFFSTLLPALSFQFDIHWPAFLAYLYPVILSFFSMLHIGSVYFTWWFPSD